MTFQIILAIPSFFVKQGYTECSRLIVTPGNCIIWVEIRYGCVICLQYEVSASTIWPHQFITVYFVFLGLNTLKSLTLQLDCS